MGTETLPGYAKVMSKSTQVMGVPEHLEDVFTIMIPQNTGVITLNSAELIGSSTQTI
jgi:hypothetical protein